MELENGTYYQINWTDEEGVIGLKIPTKGNDPEYPSFIREDGIEISVPIERVVGPVVVGSCELPIERVAKDPMYISKDHEEVLLEQGVDIEGIANAHGFNGYAIYGETPDGD